MQIKSGKFMSISPVKLKLDKPMVVLPNDTCVLLKPESQSIRIIGNGEIQWAHYVHAPYVQIVAPKNFKD